MRPKITPTFFQQKVREAKSAPEGWEQFVRDYDVSAFLLR